MNISVVQKKIDHTHSDLRVLWMLENGSSQSGDQLIGVTAKIKDLEAWRKLPQLQRQGSEVNMDKEIWLVTARIKVRDFEELHRLPFVLHIESAMRVTEAKS